VYISTINQYLGDIMPKQRRDIVGPVHAFGVVTEGFGTRTERDYYGNVKREVLGTTCLAKVVDLGAGSITPTQLTSREVRLPIGKWRHASKVAQARPVFDPIQDRAEREGMNRRLVEHRLLGRERLVVVIKGHLARVSLHPVTFDLVTAVWDEIDDQDETGALLAGKVRLSDSIISEDFDTTDALAEFVSEK